MKPQLKNVLILMVSGLACASCISPSYSGFNLREVPADNGPPKTERRNQAGGCRGGRTATAAVLHRNLTHDGACDQQAERDCKDRSESCTSHSETPVKAWLVGVALENDE